MCGVAAIAGAVRPDLDAVERMVGCLRHRGPDATGVAKQAGCHLGHARLSIIDLEHGRQPMADESGRYWLTFNGEIYNYAALRDELQACGRRFHTHSDTEVLLAAYLEWGRACVQKFRGMFAFVIWDARERTVFAARDLFGEKPLYYATTAQGQLVIASEIKALRASGLVDMRIAPDALDAYLALGYLPPDRSLYADIRPVPPAHTLHWHAGRITLARYWDPRPAPQPIDVNEAADRLRELMRSAVQRQMVADVPVGAFLSGGHDSSTVVALMREIASGPVKTFAVGFGEADDELPFARAVARRYETDHHELVLQPLKLGELLQRMVAVYDEPFVDPSAVPTYLVSQFAATEVKVVLTGDGADELFGGYGWYPLLAASSEASGSLFAWLVLRAASRLIRDRVASLALRSRALGMAVRWPDAWERYIFFRQIFSEADRATLWQTQPHAAARIAAEHVPPDQVAGMDRALYFDLRTFLPGDILVKVDRAAMAHSLETRVPFLDRDLAEFALRLPSRLKVDARETKILFKRAFADLWPSEVRDRGKRGFTTGLRGWLEREDVRSLYRHVFRPGGALVGYLPGAPRFALAADYQRWSLLTLGLWLEQHT